MGGLWDGAGHDARERAVVDPAELVAQGGELALVVVEAQVSPAGRVIDGGGAPLESGVARHEQKAGGRQQGDGGEEKPVGGGRRVHVFLSKTA